MKRTGQRILWVCLGTLIGVIFTKVYEYDWPRAPEPVQRPEYLREGTPWLGTTVGGAPDPKIAAAFEACQLIPESRRRIFFKYMRKKSEFQIRGWRVAVISDKIVDGEREIIANVYPRFWGTVFLGLHSLETWHVSKRGKLEFVKTEQRGSDGIMVD